MKIENIKISEYGCIEDKEINFGEGISIIKGDNESGKSTTHQAMLDMMFGFLNSGRKNSFKLSEKVMPFSGGSPRIDAHCIDAGGKYYVSRYFDGQSPRLSVAKGDFITRSENIALDVFNGISRDSYEGIYSLNIDQIVKLKQSWEREQDSILAGLLPDFLLPNDTIMKNIDNSIKQAWKGKSATKLTKAKEIESEIAELKSKMHQAKSDQNELREIELLEEETQSKIQRCQESIVELTKFEIDIKRQLDFYKEYAEINKILIENSKVKKYEQVPQDADHYLKNAAISAKQGKGKVEELQKKVDKLKETVNKFESLKKLYTIYKDLVPKAQKTSDAIDSLKVRIDRASVQESEKKSKISSKIKRMFTKAFSWDRFKELMNINIADCFALLESIADINAQKAEVSQLALQSKTDTKGGIDTANAVLFIGALAGLAMIFLPLGIDKMIALIIGALIFLVSTIVLLSLRLRPKYANDSEYAVELNELNSEYNRVFDELYSRLDFDFIPQERLNRIDEALIESIAQLQDDYSEYTRIKDELQKDSEELQQKIAEINKISMDVLAKSINYKSDTAEMKEKLENMQKLENEAVSAQREINLLEEQMLEVKNDIAFHVKRVEEISSALYDVEGDDINQKAIRLMHMRRSYISAENRMEVQKKKYEDYDELVNAVDKKLEAKIYELKTRQENAAKKLEQNRIDQQELSLKKGELGQKKENLKEHGLSPAVIDGKIADLKKERQRRIKLRDEYAIAYGIIQKSREKFISERSPEFLDTAGKYLGMITDNKYNKIRLDDKGASIVVMQNSSRLFDFDKIDATISRGTREQIYLALRLAMLNRFDPKGEKLPIVLDEALVNWDAERFTKLMKIMDEISKERQVFMFTCHDYVVDIVKNTNKNYELINI